MNQAPRVRPLALVTGVGSPLGRALAQLLAERQMDLLLVDSDGDRLLELRGQLGSVMVHVQLFQCDIAMPAQRRELLSFLSLAGAKPDLLALLPEGTLSEQALAAPEAEARRLQEAVLVAADGLLRGGLLAGMLTEGNGYVLAVVDEEAFSVGHPPWPAALHHGLECYALGLGREAAPRGVHVMAARAPASLLRRRWDVDDAALPVARRMLDALFARKPRWPARTWWRG